MTGSHICGCYIYNPEIRRRTYLPQVKLDAHTTILSTASRTILTQTFINDSKTSLSEIKYAFPLYDGVSVVEFYCEVGERTIYGLVKEKNEAKKTYEEAKERGESAALLEQLPDAADVFATTISNVSEGAAVKVTLKYVQELKHDAEVDGVRLTIPTSIAPRYGSYPGDLQKTSETIRSDGISITVDISMAEGIPIKKIISPSYPIQITLGSLSSNTIDEDQSLSRGSATLALGTTELQKDFVLQVVVNDVGSPQAVLETHPTMPNQRALMATLVPKFNLKSQRPEIILIADRSGSMQGENISTLVSALKVFLKSIPLGCTFNICSFGSRSEFLWEKSKAYGEETLTEAIKYVEGFAANFGGTETLRAVQACVAARNTDTSTELILLTDGDIWSQQQLFDYVSRETEGGDVRVFPLGIGGGVSSSLIEGVARAGNGFAQMVANNEKMDSKVVRMLKGALTPHINDYRLEIKYEDDSVEAVADSLRISLNIDDSHDKTEDKAQPETKPISLYDPEAKEEHPKEGESQDTIADLPPLQRPKLLQTPHKIPPLYPFHRTCVYLLMAPESSHLRPKSVILKGTSPQGPLELEIPVQLHKETDTMIHQLAARKATQELEESHGWISDAKIDSTSALIRKAHPAMYNSLLRREAVRLGVEFQIAGKHCSFVAVETNEAEIAAKRQKALQAAMGEKSTGKDEDEEDWEILSQPSGQPRRSWAMGGSRSAGPTVYGKPSNAGSSNRTLLGGIRLASCGMGTGGAFRHRKVAPSVQAEVEEEQEESDEDMAPPAYLFDDGNEDTNQPTQPKEPLLQRLIAHQTFSGAWPALSHLPCAGELGVVNADEAAKAAAQKLVDTKIIAADMAVAERILAMAVAEQILATALVIKFLEKNMADEEETWELVADKARDWLRDTVGDAGLEEVWRVSEELLGGAAAAA